MIRATLLTVSIWLTIPQAHAGMIEQTYTEYVSVMTTAIDEVLNAHQLTQNQHTDIRRAVLNWVVIGPCRKGRDVEDTEAFEFIAKNGRPGTQSGDAIMSMIGVLMYADQGRESAFRCQFAKDLTSYRRS